MNEKQGFLRSWCKTDNTLDFQSENSGSNPEDRIYFDLVDDKTKRFQFEQIIKNYHGYKQSTRFVGRILNWLIKIENSNKIIGSIGLGSSIMSIKPRDDYIGWTKEQRLRNLVKTGNNWRFCLIDKGKGYGSKVIHVLHKTSQKDWYNTFGDKLVLLETLVEPPYKGTCYKASGWVYVGMTKGLQFQWKKKDQLLPTDKVAQKFMKFGKQIDYDTWKVVTGTNTPKHIFVKPLHRYWKKELCDNTLRETGVNKDDYNKI